jgi:uroporphyrin-3 C-methyltransferase
MSDSHTAQPTPSTPDNQPVLERALVVAEPPVMAPDTWLVPRKWALLVAALAAGGLLASGLLWQKLGNIQEELARRSIDSGAQAIEARALARQAQEGHARTVGAAGHPGNPHQRGQPAADPARRTHAKPVAFAR